MSDIPDTDAVTVAKIAAALTLAKEFSPDEKDSYEDMFEDRLERVKKAYEIISQQVNRF